CCSFAALTCGTLPSVAVVGCSIHPLRSSSTKASPAYARVNSASVQKAAGRTKGRSPYKSERSERTPSPAPDAAPGRTRPPEMVSLRLWRLALAAADGVAHPRVGLEVAEVVVVHHSQVALAEGVGDGLRHLGFGGDEAGALLLHGRAHLLFERHRRRAPLLGAGLRHPQVGRRLVRLELRPDVVAHVDVGDVDGEDLEGRARVEALGEDRLGDV